MGVTLLFVTVPFFKMVFSPLKVEEVNQRWNGNACMQSTLATCGPASAASIFRFLGYPSSEKQIAESSYTSATGTEAWYLARYVRSRGLLANFYFQDSFDSSILFPAIVGVRVSGNGHFIAVLKIKDGIITYVDPMIGMREMKLAVFATAFDFTGFHLIISGKEQNHVL